MSYPLVPPYYAPPPDYIISAPTGSGKTLAYTIPMVDILSRRVVPRLRALIVLPTRELVIQVKETIEAVCKGTGLVVSAEFAPPRTVWLTLAGWQCDGTTQFRARTRIVDPGFVPEVSFRLSHMIHADILD